MRKLAEERNIPSTQNYNRRFSCGNRGQADANRDLRSIIDLREQKIEQRAAVAAQHKPDEQLLARLDEIISNLTDAIHRALPYRRGNFR